MAIEYVEGDLSVETFNAMRTSVGWFAYDPEDARKGIEDSLYCVCAKDGGKVVGMARVIGDGRITFYVQDVIVREEYQGRGIGSEIMKRVMEYIHSHAGKGAVIGLCSRNGKEHFYSRFGFHARPNEWGGAGMTQMHDWP